MNAERGNLAFPKKDLSNLLSKQYKMVRYRYSIDVHIGMHKYMLNFIIVTCVIYVTIISKEWREGLKAEIEKRKRKEESGKIIF